MPPPLAGRRKRRFGPIALTAGSLGVVGAVAVVVLAVVFIGARDPGGEVPQPHRAGATGPRPAAGQPQWAAPGHHWVGLSEDWDSDGGFGKDLDEAGFASPRLRLGRRHRPPGLALSGAVRDRPQTMGTGTRRPPPDRPTPELHPVRLPLPAHHIGMKRRSESPDTYLR